MDTKTASFLGTIIIGSLATLGLVIAAAVTGNAWALKLALLSGGTAYLCQALITYMQYGVNIPQAAVNILQGLSIAAWFLAFLSIAF